eukprot:ANDGO_03498.mRNA.1 Inositol-3-phosphate synthase
MLLKNFTVSSPNVTYSAEAITSTYEYHLTKTVVSADGSSASVEPTVKHLELRTERNVPKLGLMLVGWGGNNGTTVTAGIIANREGITWRTARGIQKPDYYGSLTQCSTLRIGSTTSSSSSKNEELFVPFHSILPMVNPNDLVLGGWDISSMNLAQAMERASVLDYDLQRQLVPYMENLKPLPSIYFPEFIAANQADRADNVISGSKWEQVEKIRADIREFKAANKVDKVILLWTANTERFSDVVEGLNDTADNLLAALKRSEGEISPSSCFAIASILEGCTYINGSPQNTFVPGVTELAEREGVYIAGDDFKSGQTKMKSVLVDFLVSAGLKPTSIVSYNHLGNNDGKNLSAPQCFRSKEISKSNVVDDMVESNGILYDQDEHPDHVVVIKYVPYVGDSKRAMDEYTSRIFMGGHNTIVLHNTCEDSLLAAPLILDLVILGEMMERIQWRVPGQDMEWQKFDSVLSVLAYLLKAPQVPENTPVINALFKQRACIENLFRACVGLQPDNNMMLEYKVPAMFRRDGKQSIF